MCEGSIDFKMNLQDILRVASFSAVFFCFSFCLSECLFFSNSPSHPPFLYPHPPSLFPLHFLSPSSHSLPSFLLLLPSSRTLPPSLPPPFIPRARMPRFFACEWLCVRACVCTFFLRCFVLIGRQKTLLLCSSLGAYTNVFFVYIYPRGYLCVCVSMCFVCISTGCM